jgi:hypothetical protein
MTQLMITYLDTKMIRMDSLKASATFFPVSGTISVILALTVSPMAVLALFINWLTRKWLVKIGTNA